ncbi:MAG: acetylxylan esterase [Acidobacteria bacterium]|nr:acetylxylan esterase [Acidobacteriota bacterium]
MKRYARLTLALCLVVLTLQAQTPTFTPNYDEAKVGNYTLPDPLKMNDGTVVKTAQQWRKRRTELLELFAREVYGRTPTKKAAVSTQTTATEAKAVSGLATRREITLTILGKPLHLLLYTPNQAKGRVPVFLGLNFNGNHAIESDPTLTLAKSWLANTKDGGVVNHRATGKVRGHELARWPLAMILKRGYAVVTLHANDSFPDHKDGLAESFAPLLYRAGQTAPAADDWNALSVWAWSLSQVVDYLERDRAIDAKRIAVIGHSRMGKATLWAAAQDERFALVISNESGEGGAALARRNWGENVWRINTAFPHWFNGNFKKYSDDPNTLPTDQHELLALIAPRPLYVASAVEDQWADPRGEFLSAQAASAVYRLLGREGVAADAAMPDLHKPIMTTVGYHIRGGKHDVTDYDWEQYLKFADQQWRR